MVWIVPVAILALLIIVTEVRLGGHDALSSEESTLRSTIGKQAARWAGKETCPTFERLQQHKNQSAKLDYLDAFTRWVFKNDVNLTYSHMSTIERLPNGSLVVAWQGSRQFEGQEDQHIYLSASMDRDGRQWGPAQRVNVNSSKVAVPHCAQVEIHTDRWYSFNTL
ncbi:hypothetical protein CYMTET_28365 [Cymbomonas tetramitiformis]|uniref:Uncharacterized protein n=1 Tax=Cymbomonas tetramitiformis TaxID=36881 RepID=A0AAE0KVZ6_9CHLO|nr:hypothetical protein CYMTET_28365 [Cymbomonas tetramitiformis]